jgi:hypothetical protein
MRCWWLIFMLFLSLALGPLGLGRPSARAQMAPAASPKPNSKPSATPSKLAPDAAVITIEGLCGGDPLSLMRPGAPSKPAGSKATVPQATKNSGTVRNGGCRTVITRAQFEKLAAVVAPNRPPQAAVQLAHFYSAQLLYAQKAHELGLDKDPHFDEILRFTYLQVLGRAFTNHLQQVADAKTNAEFEPYFKQHPEEFEQVQVLQISVPKQKLHSDESGAPTPSNTDPAADAAALKEEADKIHARAVAGEDFEKLENEVYVFAGNPDESPDTDMGDNTRAEMAPFDKEVFALQPGQVSEVLSGTEAWHIFKVVSKHMMSTDEAKKRIAAKRMKEAMEAVDKSVKSQLNETYFETAGAEASKPSEDPN